MDCLREYKFLAKNYTVSYFAFFAKWWWNYTASLAVFSWKKYGYLTHLSQEYIKAQKSGSIILDSSQSP